MDVLVDSAELDQVALSWLERGAIAFGVWRDGEPVVCWPEDGEAVSACIRAAIGRRGSTDELRAYGIRGESAQTRLNADAALLGRIVAADAELEAMADDLLESQDQLVALYDLARSTKDLLSVDAVLASVTREAARLVRAEAAFAILASTDPPTIVQHPTPKLTAGLGLVNRQAAPLTSPDLKLIRTLANQAAARIENVLLHAEAVQRARLDDTAVDLAIIDIAMPGMDGLTLLRRLREQERLQSLPVIMLSASGQDEDRQTARSLGARDFLSKPAGSHDVLEAVGRFLD